MQTSFNYYREDECPWYYFDSSYKTLLGSCLTVFAAEKVSLEAGNALVAPLVLLMSIGGGYHFISGVFGVLLNGWLYVTFLHSHLIVYKSHLLVFSLCFASLGRNLLGFPFSSSSAIAKRWLFGPACCQLFAFLNNFFGIFQMTTLFVLVLERYLLANQYRREKSLYNKYYGILIGLCWTTAILFSVPPLYGYGMYSCDATSTVCAFLWPSPTSGSKQLGYTIPYVAICGFIPVIAMFYFMGKAVRLETIYYKSEMQKDQKRLTKSIHSLVVATLALWLPAAVLAGWQWLPLLVLGYRPHVPQALALLAPVASEAATCAPVLCYLASDERLRAALLGRVRRNYALLPPKQAKRYNVRYQKPE